MEKSSVNVLCIERVLNIFLLCFLADFFSTAARKKKRMKGWKFRSNMYPLTVSLSLALESWKKVKKQHKAEDERAKYKKVHIIIFFSQFLCCFPRSLTFRFSSNISQFHPTTSPQNRQLSSIRGGSFLVSLCMCFANVWKIIALQRKKGKNSTKIGGWRGWSFEWELLENNITASHRSFQMRSLRTVLLFGLAIFQQFFSHYLQQNSSSQQQTHSMLIFLVRQIRCCLIPLLFPILPHSVNIITRNDSAI